MEAPSAGLAKSKANAEDTAIESFMIFLRLRRPYPVGEVLYL